MEFLAKEVSINKIKAEAEELYRDKGFFCSEAVVSSIRSNFDVQIPEEVIQMASGFPIGIGRAKCLCGALGGAVRAVSMFFGRHIPGDPKIEKNFEVSKELHDWFKSANGKNATCCRVLTREFDMAQKEHKDQCVYFTGICAAKTAEIICRELGVVNTDAVA